MWGKNVKEKTSYLELQPFGQGRELLAPAGPMLGINCPISQTHLALTRP
jgi:hypothetical protein